MKLSDFDYTLPPELIAQDPLADRSASRLMVLDKMGGGITHSTFSKITEYLRAGDCLVLNNTRVIPARLFGEREGSGGKVEVLLLKRVETPGVARKEAIREEETTVSESGLPTGQDTESTVSLLWECLVKPGKKLKEGATISFGGGLLRGEVQAVLEDGNRLIRFTYEGIFEEILDRLGEMPLPPYITHTLKDKERYQTVYAKWDGSAAAPTAGLHFTPELLQEIRKMGVSIAEVTLHVGLSTFRPVKTEQVLEHHMHEEFYQITKEAARLINDTKQQGGRIICVGTTACRTIESAVDSAGQLQAKSAWTDIFIYPGYKFKLLDGLITNFHLPKSTLLMLVSALIGRDQVLKAYLEAVKEQYRFFSFGDAMLIL
ncbi:S-adenosylmethionine:tRNA ribosyltransferase-isomerase [Clostridia bacterium]|nr:S-adenosylmethionine:tRNA ribosyltransferase-isomerase [Clostridia bacterium]